MRKIFILISLLLAVGCTIRYPTEYVGNPEGVFEDKIGSKKWTCTEISTHKSGEDKTEEYFSFDSFIINSNENILNYKIFYSDSKPTEETNQYLEIVYKYKVIKAKKDCAYVELTPQAVTKQMYKDYVSNIQLMNYYKTVQEIFYLSNCPDTVKLNNGKVYR